MIDAFAIPEFLDFKVPATRERWQQARKAWKPGNKVRASSREPKQDWQRPKTWTPEAAALAKQIEAQEAAAKAARFAALKEAKALDKLRKEKR